MRAPVLPRSVVKPCVVTQVACNKIHYAALLTDVTVGYDAVPGLDACLAELRFEGIGGFEFPLLVEKRGERNIRRSRNVPGALATRGLSGGVESGQPRIDNLRTGLMNVG